MKFSEIEEADWAELQPFLDTCLLPVSGLTGEETPAEATDKAASTGAWLAPLEKSFTGRTVTLPAFHYYSRNEKEDIDRLNRLCRQLRKHRFRYVIAVCGIAQGLPDDLLADLVIQPDREDQQPDEGALRKAVTELWRKGSTESLGEM